MRAVVQSETQPTSKTTKDCVIQRARSTQLLEAVQPVDSGFVAAAAGKFRPALELNPGVELPAQLHSSPAPSPIACSTLAPAIRPPPRFSGPCFYVHSR